MTSARVGWALTAGILAVAMTGCQSGDHGAGKATGDSRPTAAVTSAGAVVTPADVTGAPTVTVSTVMLSTTWKPKLDTLLRKNAACQDPHTRKCAAFMAAAHEAGTGFLNAVLTTGTEGRYVHAKPQAQAITGASTAYDYYQCGSAGATNDSFCTEQVLAVTSSTTMLQTQMRRDEHDAGLN
jgi:hypothetical protein